MSHCLDCCKAVKLIKHLGNVHKMSGFLSVPCYMQFECVPVKHCDYSTNVIPAVTHRQGCAICVQQVNYLPYQSIQIICHRKNIKLPSLTLQHSHCCVRVSTQNDHFWNVHNSNSVYRIELSMSSAEWMFLALSNMNLICNICSTRDQKGLWVPTRVSVELGHLGIFPIWTCVTKASDTQRLALLQMSKVLRFLTWLMWSQVMQCIQYLWVITNIMYYHLISTC